MRVRILDTRAGDSLREFFEPAANFVERTGHDVIVCDGVSIPWVDHAALLDRIAEVEFLSAVAAFHPWWPGRARSEAAFREHFSVVGKAEWTTFAVAKPASSFFADALRARERMGGDQIGTWLLGTTNDVDAFVSAAQMKAGQWNAPLEVAVSMFDSLHAALCLDEMQQSTLMTRISERNEQWATQLVATCQELGR